MFAAAAGVAAAQSSSSLMLAESSEMSSNVSTSQSVDTRCCVLCSQHGDISSVVSVRLSLLSLL